MDGIGEAKGWNDCKPFLRDYCEQHLEKNGGKFNCPICGSGTGENGTSAFSITRDGLKWHCYSGNHPDDQRGGDIFDLCMFIENCNKYESFLKVQEFCTGKPGPRRFLPSSQSKAEAGRVDYLDFIIAAEKRIQQTDYMQKRGISLETLQKCHVGYVPAWRHPNAPKQKASPRIILPAGPYQYTARFTGTSEELDELNKDIPKDYQLSKAMKAGMQEHLFHNVALKENYVFVVEGEIDALSILEAGFHAVATGGNAAIKKVVGDYKQANSNAFLIVAMDSDDAGTKEAQTLDQALTENEIPHIKEEKLWIAEGLGCKDANELLTRDREILKKILAESIDKAKAEERRAEEEARAEDEAERLKYEEEFSGTSILNKLHEHGENLRRHGRQNIPTGFQSLDEVLDGGLLPGTVTTIGGITSLGKTTFIMQIAESIAAIGTDALVISLEMENIRLVAKSISRITFANSDEDTALTMGDVISGDRWGLLTERQSELFKNAVEEYSKKICPHLFIKEVLGDFTVLDLRELVKKHIKLTGRKPVVFVDYLQQLQPIDNKMNDTQIIDENMKKLDQMSRELQIAVVLVSSFNRSSYQKKVAFEGFRDSGKIEYSSRVVLGLQLRGVGGDNFDIDEAKSKNPREIELVVLKNSFGPVGNKLNFRYFAKFNLYEEDLTESNPGPKRGVKRGIK